MLQRLLSGGAKISGDTAESARAYVRQQLRIIRPDEVETFSRWSDIISYYRGVQTEHALIRDWLLPATHNAHDLMATWSSRCEALQAPATATTLYEARLHYYRSGEQWLSAMADSLERTVRGDPAAKRRQHDVTLLVVNHQEARVRAEKEMQRLVKRLA